MDVRSTLPSTLLPPLTPIVIIAITWFYVVVAIRDIDMLALYWVSIEDVPY
jgi:hypothetical protein